MAGRSLGIDVVLAGHVKKAGDIYTISLTPLDARVGRARPGQKFTATGRPTEIVKFVETNANIVCAAIDPEWKPVIKVVAREETPTPADPPPPAVKPPAAEDAPLLPDFDLPDDPVTTPPPVVAPKPADPAPPATALAGLPVATEPTPVAPPPPPAKVEPPPVVTSPPPVAPPPPAVTPLPVTPPAVTTPALAATTPMPETADPARDMKITPVAHPFPWVFVTGGGAILTGLVGLGLGISSHSIWSGDHPLEQGGVERHTVTHAQALSANRLAIGADVLFGVAGALGITTGVLIYSNGGLGLSGRF